MENFHTSYYEYLKNRNLLSLLIRRFFIRDFVRHFHGLVLDIGCGIGEFLDLYQKGIGFDINPYVVRHCMQQGHSCCIGDATVLPFQNCSFDGVLLSNILEHFNCVEGIIAEAKRVLRIGGKIVVSVPSGEAGFIRDPTHVHMFTEQDLCSLAKSYDLQTKTIYHYPFRIRCLGKYLYFCELRVVFVKNNF